MQLSIRPHHMGIQVAFCCLIIYSYLLPLQQDNCLVQWLAYLAHKSKVGGSSLTRRHFSIFLKIMIFNLAITSLGQFGGSRNFYILMYVSIGSYHININFGLSRALCPILLSKITKFSPKNLRFFPVKIFWWVQATFQS